MDRCFASILFNTSIILTVLLMIPWKNFRKPPDPQESSSKVATMCVKNFVIYKLSHQSFPVQIWIYILFLDLFGFLDSANTHHVTAVGWWASGNNEIFYLPYPVFCWIHQESQKIFKIGHPWSWQPLCSNKNYFRSNQSPTNVTLWESQYITEYTLLIL